MHWPPSASTFYGRGSGWSKKRGHLYRTIRAEMICGRFLIQLCHETSYQSLIKLKMYLLIQNRKMLQSNFNYINSTTKDPYLFNPTFQYQWPRLCHGCLNQSWSAASEADKEKKRPTPFFLDGDVKRIKGRIFLCAKRMQEIG